VSKKFVDLSNAQKEEIRRLTQLANRRIKAAQRAYAKEGLDVTPAEVTGQHQIKEQWHTESTPLSRSVKFQSQAEYRKQLNYLRSFERQRPGIKEYTDIQREKTNQALESSLGTSPPDSLRAKIDTMSPAQLSQFWKTFSDKSSKLGIKYSSSQAMAQSLSEFFPEDMANFNSLTKKWMTESDTANTLSSHYNQTPPKRITNKWLFDNISPKAGNLARALNNPKVRTALRKELKKRR
jgi:hypothetical protein